MSKIICDVCGTAYAENASQCPICGSAKRADRNINAGQGDGSSYQFVKGGRFSKKNVKKRNKENQANKAAKKNPKPPREEEKEHSGVSKGLMIILLLLIAAALALLIYIGLKFFMPGPSVPDTTPPNNIVDTTPSTQPSQTEPSTEPTDPTGTEPETIPCQGLMLQEARIVLEKIGDSAQIKVSLLPSNSTDPVIYTSMNEQVAQVDEHGYVLAVGHGETKINVSCGDFSVNCEVRVTAPATEPSTEPTTEPTTEPEFTVELNRADITMFYEGETWRLYIGSAPVDEVIWSTDDEKVAVFERGTVKAVGPGETVVYAEYGDQKIGCIIRCNWEPDPTEPTEEPTQPTEPEIEPGIYVMHINGDLPSELYGADVSLGIGDSFTLTVVSPSGNIVDVDWQADEDGIVTIDGNTITGAGAGMVYVSAVYNDQTFVCIVRVS